MAAELTAGCQGELTGELTGGCQCGGIRYEATGAPLQVVACHCTACQRQSGSAFGMSMVVRQQDFRITRGEVKTYASKSDAGRAKLGAFCPDCGTRIYHQSELRQGNVSIKAGTLDDTSTLTPDIHIWTASKQPWDTIPRDVEAHEKNPS